MCDFIASPNIMPGFGCCHCKTYNGLQRKDGCKSCGTKPCEFAIPPAVSQCVGCGFGWMPPDVVLKCPVCGHGEPNGEKIQTIPIRPELMGVN